MNVPEHHVTPERVRLSLHIIASVCASFIRSAAVWAANESK